VGGWGWLLVPSLLGGTLGALLLVRLPPRSFAAAAPWLVLGSTLLFAVEPALRRRLRPASQGAGEAEPVASGAASRERLLAHLAQLLIAVYGGYFGAGIGILMLASLGLSGVDDLAQASGLKNLLAAAIKGAAVIYLATTGEVRWLVAAAMVPGAVLGGWAGAALAMRVPPRALRWGIVVMGLLMTAATFAGVG
jgi:hypothetical protein